jgi:hypothetical protein
MILRYATRGVHESAGTRRDQHEGVDLFRAAAIGATRRGSPARAARHAQFCPPTAAEGGGIPVAGVVEP